MYTDSGSPFKFLIRYNNFLKLEINNYEILKKYPKKYTLVTNLQNNRFSIPS